MKKNKFKIGDKVIPSSDCSENAEHAFERYKYTDNKDFLTIEKTEDHRYWGVIYYTELGAFYPSSLKLYKKEYKNL